MVDVGQLGKFNLVWTTPSLDHNGSMPAGNGETGVNAWVEKSGDLVFLISRTDAWDENERLCKIGRIRVGAFPEIDEKDDFRQELNLYHGKLLFNWKRGAESREVILWVDAHKQVIRLEIQASSPIEPQIDLELWRNQKREFQEGEDHFVQDGFKGTSYIHPDTVWEDVAFPEPLLVWFHQNPVSPWRETLIHQGLGQAADELTDPLLNRIFGAAILAPGYTLQGERSLIPDQASKSLVISVFTHTRENCSPPIWLGDILDRIDMIGTIPKDTARRAHEEWWAGFWDRSWIFVKNDSSAWEINRVYILQRWIQACGGRGNYPIKFNGSIFTVNTKFDPDYRRWGGHYWFQNTRLVYWPMLASGDFDLMQALFKMYSNIRPLAKLRNQVYFKHEGWFFPETMSFWGTYDNGNYGWDREGKQPGDPIQNEYIRYHFNGSLELLTLMVEYYRYTEDVGFLKEYLLPMAGELLSWWHLHWNLDANGKLYMYPSHALETYWEIENPTPDIAGLLWVTQELLSIPLEEISEEGRQLMSEVEMLRSKIPDIPARKKRIQPHGGAHKKRTNSENPELYTVFPFRLYGLGSEKEKISLARKTFKARKTKGAYGWRQDDTQAAFLGLVKDAKKLLLSRANRKNKKSRFPAFWGPNMDWIPDQDHGGNLLMAFQAMLLQSMDSEILLFPAWPRGWDVDFKLHARDGTIVECRMEKGKIVRLRITPEDRRKSIRILGGLKEMQLS